MKVPGHELRNEGAPFERVGTVLGVIGLRTNLTGTGGVGRALCSCTAMSGVLGSAQKRKAWHRAHKDAVLRGEA